MNKSILLCGVGGQGTVLASKMIASACMARDIPVMSAETIGMAQKGGSVFSHVKLGDGLNSPMIPLGGADILIAFEPAEAVRMLPYLKEGGSAVVNSRAIKPVTATLTGGSYDGSEMIACLKERVKALTVIDCAAACEELGSPKALNMVLLGAAVDTGELFVTREDLIEAMKARVKPQFFDMNIRALNYVREHRG